MQSLKNRFLITMIALALAISCEPIATKQIVAKNQSRVFWGSSTGGFQVGVSSVLVLGVCGEKVPISVFCESRSPEPYHYVTSFGGRYPDCMVKEVNRGGYDLADNPYALPQDGPGSSEVRSFAPSTLYVDQVDLATSFIFSKASKRYFKFGVEVSSNGVQSDIWSPIVEVIVAPKPIQTWTQASDTEP